MGFLIDPSILIDFSRGELDVARHIEGRGEDDFYLSAVSAAELLLGARLAQGEPARRSRSAFVEAVLETFPLLLVDRTVARMHAQLSAQLLKENEGMPLHDTWLAASCLAHGLTLATSDPREFEKVRGLKLEMWKD